MVRKRLFCKIDCFQTYHCLRMADYQSIQMLAFNFACRTFAYRRLAQGLSRSLSAFSSFMSKYLHKAIKAGQCAQYVDDNGIAANDAKQLCTNIRTVFECIRNSGLKLTCPNVTSVLIGSTSWVAQLHPTASTASRQSHKFPVLTEIPQIQISTPTVHRILELLPQLHPETL